jgi:hypothetical protein
MKKLFLIVCTLVIGGAISFGQATGGNGDPSTTNTPKTTSKTATGKKATKTKAHKGGKKGKKSSGGTSTTPPQK